MALQGTLDTFSLPDVLRLLATTSKTGRLRIEGDRGHGSVWLAGGGIVDADAERAVEGTSTEEVIFELLRFTSGSFAFDGDDVAAGSGRPEDVETVLKRANSLLSEWTELEAVVPSLEHEVSLSGDLSADEVTIDAERWRSLVAVAAGCTVGELATTLGLTELGASRAVRDLVDLGVAEVEPPGTHPAPARRGAGRGREAASLPPPAPTVTESDSVAAVSRTTTRSERPKRAGWLRTGEVPAVGGDRRGATASNGQPRDGLDDTGGVPAPERPTKGGLASRLGRGRSASTSGRNPEPPPTAPTPAISAGPAPTTGRTPAAPPARTNDAGRSRNGADAGSTGRTPAAPPARTNDAGRSRNGADAGTTGRHEIAAPRTPPAPPSRPADRPSRPAGPPRPPMPPALPGGGPSPFDGGRLGPSPRDTGQIRPISPNSLPPDLHWAADDTGSLPLNGGPPTSPFSGLSSLGPSRPAPADGEIAPHVAAMSPDARAAVQATVGNAGGAAPGRAMPGDDLAQRGRLISFLSSVR
ncbi:MAG TPA: DUF4388 domain-containing protein [Acidimicrobiales bacterium]